MRRLIGLCFAGLAVFIPPVDASPLSASIATSCKCIPGDPCWPNQSVFSRLNETLQGQLISTVPLASICHDPKYEEHKCETLKTQWDYAAVQYGSPVDKFRCPYLLTQDSAVDPSSVMMPVFQNSTCDPFQPVESPCTLGNLVRYSVNASDASLVQSAIRFAAAHNIRVAVKNTGHDFLGRSTAKHALGIWTHHMDGMELIRNYTSPMYRGPAMKMGAGTQAWQAYQAAHSWGYRVVGGSCPTVGLAGGFTQGGGHGVLSSQHGLAADNVVEWQVVTSSGELVTASPTTNPDLYWALSGGGGGTFGVVVSMTTKLFPEAPVTGGRLDFNFTSEESFWGAVSVLQSGLTPLVDSGTVLLVGVTNSTASAVITAPEVDKPTLQGQLGYITSHLKQSAIPYDLTVQTDPSYYDHFSRYFGPLPHGIWPVSHLMGGRLLPRSLFESPKLTASLAELGKSITRNNEWTISAVTLNVNHTVAQTTDTSNSVHPAWRDTLVHYTVYSPWDWSSAAEMNQRSDRLTKEIIPALEELTPGGATYANEADYRQADWQTAFYGPTWDRLSRIKSKWDATGVLYAPLSAGADSWQEKSDGRLCRV